MESAFIDRITQVRSEIKMLNKSIGGGDTYIPSPKKPKPSDDPEYRSFALKKFQSTFSYKTFKRREKEALRKLSSKYQTNIQHVTDMDSFMDKKNEAEFKAIKYWSRLDKWQRKNRIKKYVNSLERDTEIDVINVCKRILDGIVETDVKWADGCIVEIKKIDSYL